ncbi:MAG: hypothetical protein GWO20_12945 [Candidatus Korarchaeota archaeon]|nr:hypothetical protein [Candidatus Korarchaeota archaeon]NIU84335.1 hypothetical protein [Candidatus Thorarchaeota archaeon]NIW14454.1 hypothetical protein [Candidatus Thorarchaeota archaeon]NIW52521.1 hypothetical protein [Candidatus Korarchaeota archaeon]
MKHVENAIKYVTQNGNQLDKLRLKAILGKPYTLAEAEHVLDPYQFPDGSWAYRGPEEKSERIGSLGGTIHCLRWVRELALEASQHMARTLEFLTSIQREDGSFYETEAKLAHSPQQWLQEERLIDRFYFTAAVPMRLCSLGYRRHSLIEPSLEWLQHHWNNWELVAATWYGPWTLLSLYPFDVDIDESLLRRCREYTRKWIPNLETQPLTWLFDALHGAGYPAQDSIVEKGVSKLKKLQNAKGIWPDPKYSTVETTITAIRLITEYHND